MRADTGKVSRRLCGVDICFSVAYPLYQGIEARDLDYKHPNKEKLVFVPPHALAMAVPAGEG